MIGNLAAVAALDTVALTASLLDELWPDRGFLTIDDNGQLTKINEQKLSDRIEALVYLLADGEPPEEGIGKPRTAGRSLRNGIPM